MKLNPFKRQKTIKVEANPYEVPVPDLVEIAADMREVGRPLLRGEGKMTDIKGLDEIGSISRVDQLAQLERLVKDWKLHAIDAYKRKLRG